MNSQLHEAATAVANPRGSRDLPLTGVRVLDLTMVWAGPFATKHLADAGAEVIKVEGPGRTDLVRSLTIPDESAERPWNTSRYFHEYNRNKLGIAVDVRQEEGKRILFELACASDVVIDNFRPGVLDRLGLGWERLHEANPRLIQVSLPGYSSQEPERGLPGYGPNVEQMGGLAHLQGYEGGPPQKSGISYGDPLAGLGGVAGILTALVERQRTGVGRRIEVGQRNILAALIGDALVAHQFGVEVPRMGNRSRLAAPQGVYATRGIGDTPEDDTWVAISVATDMQWQALCEVIGRSDLAADPALATLAGRQDAAERLDDVIAGWARDRSAWDATEALQARGVPASPVLRPADLPRDPHLLAREFLVEVEHPELGTTRLSRPTWRMEGLDMELRPAPGLGEHNREVLGRVLGYDSETIDRLEELGVIAERPAGK